MSMPRIEMLYRDLKENESLRLDNLAIMNICGSEDSDETLIPEGLHSFLSKVYREVTARNCDLIKQINEEIDKTGHPVLLENYMIRDRFCGEPKSLSIRIGLPSDIETQSELNEKLAKAIEEYLYPIIEDYKKKKEGE